MLYDTWLRVAQERRREFALRDVAAGRSWTFSELRTAAEREESGPGALVYPQGSGAGFILKTLAAWRDGKVLCPLEPGQPPPSVPLPPVHCIHLKTTSASTGVARVIAFTEEQLAADAENIVATMRLRADWPNLAAISMAHSYGFSNLVLPLLLHGVPLILVPSPLPEALRRAAEGWTVLTLAGVPALWRTWHEARAVPPTARLAISAGAPLSLEVEEEVFSASGLKVHNFYGSSECGGIAYDRTNVPRQDANCVGVPMQNVELSLHDEGCLRVHSRAVGETYWPEPSPALGRGQFQTSDLAELEKGSVFLRGRASDQINVAGRKLAPEMVERVLRGHPGVKDCLALGVPRADGREVVAVVVVAQPSATAAKLQAFLHDHLPDWQVPRVWLFVDSLEAEHRGKVSRATWRARLAEQGPDQNSQGAPRHG